MPGSELSRDRERLAVAVQAAGGLALKFFRGPYKKWVKGEGGSPVTEADIAANELLHKALVEPGDGWLSEESENDPARLDAKRVWVIDPIDGTRAFIAGRDDWSVSAALVADGRQVAAALYAPVTGELFVATKGHGATLNAAPIRVTSGGLVGARVGGPKRVLDRMAQDGSGIVPMPRIHSLALRLARVAQGALDAAMAGGNGHDCDLAAADLLVHEAAGTMTALDGRPLIYNRPNPVHGVLIAAGRERHAALLDTVRAQTSEPGRAPAPAKAKELAMPDATPNKQLLHLVIGGELSQLDKTEFKDLAKVELVGVYPNYATAYAAWRAKAQQTVDNAEMRYFIVHLHRLLDPEATGPGPAP